MVLPIGFFAPLPLAIMIPFMAAQSFAMGHAFGTSFQYGKRKISSLTNEEFNALSATDIHGELQADIRAMIPSMNESFHRMENFQIDIINSMINTFIKAVEAFGQFIGPGGGVNPYVGTGGGGDTSFRDDFFDPNFNAQDQANLGDQAGGATSGGTAGQKFVSDYIAEAKRLPFALLASIVEKMLSGKLQNPIERMLAYKQVYKERLPPKGDDTLTGIDKSGAVGIVKQIATMTLQLKNLLSILRKSLDSFNRPTNVKVMDQFLVLAKKYNQLVTQNRNAQGQTYASLQIDTAKSMNGRPPRFIYKT